MDEQTALSIEAREAALVAWLGNRRSYRPEDLPADLNPPTNEERSAVEVYRFENGDLQRYFAYWNENEEDGTYRTTWTGDRLARVSWVGSSYCCAFGDRRRNFRAEDNCGRFWAGTYYESTGDYVRMRRVKR